MANSSSRVSCCPAAVSVLSAAPSAAKSKDDFQTRAHSPSKEQVGSIFVSSTL
jgi:hypothetical protein